MIALGPLWLLRPWWLMALPALLCVAYWVHRHARDLGGWSRVVDPRLLAAMAELGHVAGGTGSRRAYVLLATGALLALALAGPALRRADAPSFRNLDTLLLVMDMSPSITEGGNLDDAQAVAARLVKQGAGRPVGLIVFAGEAYLVAAPTDDPETLETPIAVLSADTMPDRGSHPDRALAAARELLEQANIRSGDVVLISDGGGAGPPALAEARRIRDSGAALSTVAVLPQAGQPDLPPGDPDALALLAREGGGVAVLSGDVEPLVGRVGNVRNDTIGSNDLAGLFFLELGRWFLLAAMVPAILLFGRRA